MITRIIYVLVLFCLAVNVKCPCPSTFQFNTAHGRSLQLIRSPQTVNPTWNIEAVKARQFWEATNYRGEGVTVAIIDDGVNYTLPDLDGNYLGGHDFVDNDENPMPNSTDNHGTACASIAVGEGDYAYVGVAPKAKYYALRVGYGGIPRLNYVDDAIYWALNPDHRADVISISLGEVPNPEEWSEEDWDIFYNNFHACRVAWDSGIAVVVASTGNWGKNFPAYPAGWGYAIAVGSYTENGEVPAFSNEGCDLVAPGGYDDVPALGNNGDIINFGYTSAAAPHVAGGVALLLSRHGKWATGKYQPDEVRRILKLSVKPLPYYSSWEQGAGVLDCLDIINYRSYLNNSGLESDYYLEWWNRTQPFDGEASIFENSYWWDTFPPPSECQPGIDYFDNLEGDLHLNLSLTSTAPGQNVYTGMIQPSDWFNLKAYGASRTTRELHIALRTLKINTTTSQKARIAIKICFNSTGAKRYIYYCWYARGTDINTTLTCYYRLGTATSNQLITRTRNIKEDFYKAFNTPLTRTWKIASITVEITIQQTGNYDHISLLAGEISLNGNYTNKITGDINWDGVVDIKDLTLLINAFGTYPGHSSGRWNPNADLNNDLKVDIKDLVILNNHYGEVD